jgi:nucleotide-binding universal stress UspA family protein
MNILLAIDGSKSSDLATQTVVAQARPQEDQIRVIHVVSVLTNRLPGMDGYYPGVEHARDAERAPAEALVEETAGPLRSKGLKVSTAVQLGDPRSEILDAAEKWGADLIVLGAHDRTGFGRFARGGVSDAVFRNAKCSVEIVRTR